MGTARTPIRLALALVLVVATTLLAACGDSGEPESGTGGAYGGGDTNATQKAEREQGGAPEGARATECEPVPEHEVTDLRATAIGCEEAAAIAAEWAGEKACRPLSGASRGFCQVRDMRCLSAATDRGLAVSCAMPNRSLSFILGSA